MGGNARTGKSWSKLRVSPHVIQQDHRNPINWCSINAEYYPCSESMPGEFLGLFSEHGLSMDRNLSKFRTPKLRNCRVGHISQFCDFFLDAYLSLGILLAMWNPGGLLIRWSFGGAAGAMIFHGNHGIKAQFKLGYGAPMVYRMVKYNEIHSSSELHPRGPHFHPFCWSIHHYSSHYSRLCKTYSWSSFHGLLVSQWSQDIFMVTYPQEIVNICYPHLNIPYFNSDHCDFYTIPIWFFWWIYHCSAD